jgi:SAM-dependent methyltransferase
MAQQLRRNLAASAAGSAGNDTTIEVVEGAFEDYDPPAASFDLVTAATSFHWVAEAAGLAKARRALRAGGTIALWWFVFGDPDRDDPFHEATTARLAAGRQSPSGGAAGGPNHALDIEARTSALRDAGFVDVRHELLRESGRFTPARLRDLYSTFSNTAHLPPAERDELLDYIEATAANQFGGEVVRPILVSLYIAHSP